MIALLSFIGTLGLGYGIIRFFPNSDNKARLLNFSLTFSGLAAITASVLFLAGLSLWAPKLIFIRENPLFFAAFVVVTATSTLTQITSQTFIASRRTGFTLAQSIISGVLKLAVVAVLASSFKVFGIFASWGIAAAVSLGICLLIFLPRLLPHYRPIPSLQKQTDNELVRFSFSNYIGEALRGLPGWILPLIILNVLSAEENAYFFIAWVMTNVLFAISGGASFSLFAEGSHEEGKLGGNISRSIKLIAVLLIPAILIIILFGDNILLLFGKEYPLQGTKLLWILAAAVLPASINFLYLGVARVKKKLKEIILINGAVAFGTLILSYLLLPHLGILGAGVGWLTSQTVMSLVLLLRFRGRL
ncbi:lipopolysaccharide biosynthesis protein [Chloroflexota bacterium]